MVRDSVVSVRDNGSVGRLVRERRGHGVDRWLTVTSTREFDRLREFEQHLGRARHESLSSSHLSPGAFLLFGAEDGVTSAAVLVAAERCAVGRRESIAALLRSSEWRHAKRALTESGWDQAELEELISPITQDGFSGTVDADATASYVASLQEELLQELLRYFAVDIEAWVDSWQSLADFGEVGDIPKDRLLAVPREAVMVVRLIDGRELVPE
jgi:hypothetical protein